MIYYGKQFLDDEDINSVVEALKSDFLTTGPKIKEFEEKFCNYVGSKYAVAVSSGTAALHLACLAAGLKKDEEIITSPITFVASANCAFYCDAKPVFVDINQDGLIDESKIEEKITNKTKIIIPVHYGGLPCNLEKIKSIAKKHNLTIIEDACHAIGAKYKNSKIGDCSYSDMAVFSFHPVKHITTGEGGMITTNSKQLYEKLMILRTHGITKDSSKFIYKNQGPWYYEMQELGFNYRITDFQSALGISQLQKVDNFIKKRRELAKLYDSLLTKIKDVEIIKEDKDTFNSYHLYVIKLKDKNKRLGLYNHLKENGIMCQVHYIPVYLQPFYQKNGYKKGICPNSENFYERIISLPLHVNLKQEDIVRITELISDFFASKLKVPK